MKLRLLAKPYPLACLSAALLALSTAAAAELTVVRDNFDLYSGAATNVAEVSDADIVHPGIIVVDDQPYPTSAVAGSGVQLINWLSHSAPNSLLLRSGTEVNYYFTNAMSGTKIQMDFWLYVNRDIGDRNFYLILRGYGADNNNPYDYIAYRADRSTNKPVFLFDGVPPGTGWVGSTVTHADGRWQQHRIVIDTAAMKSTLYIDDMSTPALTTDIARTQVAVPTYIRILHEGNSADDGYFAIDDFTVTVENAVNLNTTFTEGFEGYTARTGPDEDADPAGPWNVVETDGATSESAPLAVSKVQVVDSSVVPAHSGTKSLLLQAGQRAGATIAWGVPPQSDVQITWWARVPASIKGQQANFLRFSLYAAENGNMATSGDSMLLGYGSRDANLGDETSLTYFTTGWVDSQVDYTPDVWEEYRVETHSNQGRYTVTKNPSSANPIVVVDQAAFIGTATSWTPVFMAAWNSSNGTNHPPVYVDDITIKTLTSILPPLPLQYNITYNTDRFTNVTVITTTNMPVGKAVMDPRDNSTILFSIDAAPAGGIYRATKTSSGTWAIDTNAIVSNLSNPSGFDIAPDGTLWWTHDFGGQIMRLKAPWALNSAEVIIAGLGETNAATADDDPIDLVVAPQSFNGTIGKPGSIVVADRGTDGDANNTLFVIDPATTETNTVGYVNYLTLPSPTVLGAQNLNAISALPASGEVVALSTDGYITAVDGTGNIRSIWSTTLWAGTGTPNANSIAVDPTTGRIWVMDDTLEEVWSVDPTTGADRKELSFPLINPARTDRQMDNHDPGMSFSADGKYLLMTDTSVANGGGRILVFHNEAITAPPAQFKVTSVNKTAAGVQLRWESAGANASYRVLRSSSLAPANFQNISGTLTGTQYTDANAPADAAFYRIEVQP